MFRRFCKLFSESSTGRWAILQLPCCPSRQGEILEKILQNLRNKWTSRKVIINAISLGIALAVNQLTLSRNPSSAAVFWDQFPPLPAASSLLNVCIACTRSCMIHASSSMIHHSRPPRRRPLSVSGQIMDVCSPRRLESLRKSWASG